MNSSRKCSWRESLSRRVWGTIAVLSFLIWSGAGFPALGLAVQAQSAQPAPVAGAQAATRTASGAAASAAGPASEQQTTGSISGSVAGPDGGPVIAALITLARNGQTVQQALTSDNGQFSFAKVAPGAYRLTIAAPGFKTQSVSAAVQPDQTYTAPPVALALAPVVTSIKVTPSRGEIAHYQMQQEEKQRVLGFIPNYMVTYYPHTAPLSAKEKFQLTFKTVFNPYTLGLATAFVGGEQATGMYSGYGTEEKSFTKRFGAAYATLAVGAFMGDALLPSILHQDPRFYYKANGSFRSKLLYAITRSVICKGDNGHWQPDYSAVLGHFAAGGIANLYLPQQNRRGFGTTVEDGLIGIGFDAFANILQEFVIPKLTPALSHRQFGKP
ncbi:MAG: carboxypeptidase-like regulatory domain-containing protein [Acidobacteriota bacterium]